MDHMISLLVISTDKGLEVVSVNKYSKKNEKNKYKYACTYFIDCKKMSKNR